MKLGKKNTMHFSFPLSEFSSEDVTFRDGSCKAVMLLLMKRAVRGDGRGEHTKKLGP